MLDAFYNQLKEDFNQERDRLEQFLKKTNPQLLNESSIVAIRDFVLGMPEIIKVLNTLIMRQKLRPEARMVFGFLVSYLLDPQDLLPEETFGFFGYLDDAYLTARVAKWALKDTPDADMEAFGLNPDAVSHYLALLERVKLFVPEDIKNQLNAVLKNVVDGATMVSNHIDINKIETDYFKNKS